MAETSEMVERVRNAIDKAWMDWNLGDGRGRPQADVPVDLLAVAAIEATRVQELASAGLDLCLSLEEDLGAFADDTLAGKVRLLSRAALPSPPDPA